MTLLAVETSCDETSAAVIRDGVALSNIVSSQTALHAPYGGVVPELATRQHLRQFLPVAREALDKAGVNTNELEAVAATRGPGLAGALLIGWQASQALAFALRKPLLGVHHHEAHLYSPWMAGDPPKADWPAFEPCISLIVSGGHTMLVDAPSPFQHRVLGSTVDDAAGECFDKIGKLLGLEYPAGPEIDRLASGGDGRRFDFPRPMLRDAGDDFSFAGLKTSVRYFLQKNPGVAADAKALRDLCASAQAAIVEVLVAKTVKAAQRRRRGCVTASGGVACNSALRRDLAAACQRAGLKLRLADPRLSTDNAAMIGLLAEAKLRAGASPAGPDDDIQPNWEM